MHFAKFLKMALNFGVEYSAYYIWKKCRMCLYFSKKLLHFYEYTGYYSLPYFVQDLYKSIDTATGNFIFLGDHKYF